jgi:UDP-GlcNAc:undecaprenyl-phosphate GlcNAc-1-phosphate transferase
VDVQVREFIIAALTMVFVFVVTFGVSFLLTPVVRRIAISLGKLDEPNEERRVHTRAVPRLGGLAMFAAFAVGVSLTFVLDIGRKVDQFTPNNRFEPGRFGLLLLGAGIIVVVMAWDDLKGMRPVPKLSWQVAAALLVVVPSLFLPGGPNYGEATNLVHYDQGAGVLVTSVQSPFGGLIALPLVLGVIFTVSWLVGVSNAINWMDGLDGLAAGVTVVACAVLFVITGPVLGQWTLSYLPLALGAATLGFLPYNVHPARIFMGDSGSMFLGFTLGIMAIIGGAKLATALLVLGVPMLDAAYLIVYRLVRGRSPMSADRGHLHHRLLDIGLSQPQAVTVFYVLTATFGLVAYVLTALPPVSYRGLFKLFALGLLVVVMIGLLVFLARRSLDRARSRD